MRDGSSRQRRVGALPAVNDPQAASIRAFVSRSTFGIDIGRVDRDVTEPRAVLMVRKREFETTDWSDFLGFWKITHMETWAQDYVDLVVVGFVEFADEDEHLMGRFQFGTVSGWLDCRLRDLDGVTFIEWSWQGRSDTDPGCGRGWATLVDGELVGRICIHCGDDSAFSAAKQPRPAERQTRAGTKPRAQVSARRYH